MNFMLAWREVFFLLVHNKLPVRERMFRIGKERDPFCDECPGSMVCDVEHFFCSCVKVAHLWRWLRNRLVTMSGDCFLFGSDWDLVNLFLPRKRNESETVWLIGNYVYWVWLERKVKRKSFLKIEQLFGFLRFKYKSIEYEAGLSLRDVAGLGL